MKHCSPKSPVTREYFPLRRYPVRIEPPPQQLPLHNGSLPRPSRRFIDPLIYIGVIKLIKAVALFAIAASLLRLLNGDFEQNLRHFIEQLRFDPDSRYIHTALARLTGISHANLKLLDIGTFIYSALYVTEGVGLILKKYWAEWLTTIGTILFIPLEVYELVERFTAVRVLVLLLNIAIVIYLAYRLRLQHLVRKAAAQQTPAP